MNAVIPDAPTFDEIADYGSKLGDVSFWEPYVRPILRRHDLGDRSLEAGFVGTFPTFLAGDVVVKLFGRFPTWRSSWSAELGTQRLLADVPAIPAPELIGHGDLYPEAGETWPYLITSRMPGVAWRDADLDPAAAEKVAAQVGEVIRLLHDLPVDADPAPAGLDIPVTGAAAVDRHRRWTSLPDALVEQIPAYVAGLPNPLERRLIHADLTEDHIFVRDGELVGLIDWGDAMVMDRHYELSALHLGAFGGGKRLLRAFLDAYDWPVGDGFADHALGMALMHQFDVLTGTRPEVGSYADLGDLAAALFG